MEEAIGGMTAIGLVRRMQERFGSPLGMKMGCFITATGKDPVVGRITIIAKIKTAITATIATTTTAVNASLAREPDSSAEPIAGST